MSTESNKLRIAIVTAYPPSKVTLNEYGYHLVQHFKKHPLVKELIIMCDDTSGEMPGIESTPDCKITVKSCWSFNSKRNIYTVRKAIKETNPDGVMYNLQFLKFGDKKVAAALGLAMPMLTKRSGIPTISLLHNIMEEVDLGSAGFTNNKALQAIYQFIGDNLTRMILRSDIVAVTISKYVKTLETKYNKKNVRLIPHGSFETPPEPDYNLPDGPLQVMSFGKFGTYKKVEIMIDAVEKIRSHSDIDLEIVIAGTDSPNTPGYLNNIAKKYSHVKNLRFTGYVEEEEVPGIFQAAAVVVFPYTSTTGSSGVLHQAGSYGKAVALPDLGDLGILVKEEGYRGEFFDPLSADNLAEALEKVLTNDNYRKMLGEANYKAACSIPMSEVANMYIKEFINIQSQK